jgi:CheY-like chemotaxis protein
MSADEPKSILIVEDDEIACAGLSSILRSHGYRVFVAADGREAQERFEQGLNPDLILLDMILPRFDGWHFIGQRQKAKLFAGAPVIIMTGLGIASKEWALSLGAVELLRKPIDVEVLVAAVERCLARDERSSVNRLAN